MLLALAVAEAKVRGHEPTKGEVLGHQDAFCCSHSGRVIEGACSCQKHHHEGCPTHISSVHLILVHIKVALYLLLLVGHY